MTRKFSERNEKQALNLLTERLAFERAAVKLYDKLLEKIPDTGDGRIVSLFDSVQKIRNEEKEHEEWLEAQIRAIGGTAHEQTELSDLVLREAEGIEKVVMNDPEIRHLFHALQAAELVDNAGWELLLRLAEESGDRELKKEFKRRLTQEEQHLVFIQECVAFFERKKVLGEEGRLPSPL